MGGFKPEDDRVGTEDVNSTTKIAMAGVKEEQKSRLLALASELRNTIYSLSLVTDEPLSVSDKSVPNEPSLLTACKQIRKEALPIFYGENVFESRVGFNSAPVLHWLRGIGPAKSAMIKHLHLRSTHHTEFYEMYLTLLNRRKLQLCESGEARSLEVHELLGAEMGSELATALGDLKLALSCVTAIISPGGDPERFQGILGNWKEAVEGRRATVVGPEDVAGGGADAV